MNMQKYVISTVAVFVFVFAFDFIVHGKLLMGIYESTSHLWRPQNETPMQFMFLSQFLFSAALAFFFTRHYEGNGVAGGVRFGLWSGLVLASVQIGTYAYMPIPLTLSIAWAAAALTTCVGAGVVLSFTYKN